MQEIVQLLHVSFDEDGDYICSKFRSSWMLEYVLGNRCVKHRVVGTVLLFVPLRAYVTCDEPSCEQVSATCPCNCLHPESALHLPSLLCQVWLLQPFADPRFLLGLIFQNTGREPTASHKGVLMRHKSLLKLLCLFPRTFSKTKWERTERKKEVKRKRGRMRGREGGREISFPFPSQCGQQPKLLAGPVKNNRGHPINLSMLKFCIKEIHHGQRITVDLHNCYRSNTMIPT